METTCVTCSAPTARDGWCPSCLTAPAVEAPTAYAPPRLLGAPVISHEGRHTAKSTVTFGPVGRTLWTVCIVALPIPMIWFTKGLAGLGFGGLWWATVTPWALRDLWRSGRKRRIL